MKKDHTSNINILRGSNPQVLVITDALTGGAFERGEVMVQPAYDLFMKEARRSGFKEEDFVFVIPCPPIPIALEGSEAKIGKYIDTFYEEFKAVVTLGKAGNRQLAGRAVQITKARGTFTQRENTGNRPVLPLLAPFHVLRRPELRDVYDSDFRQLAALRDCRWDLEEYGRGGATEGYKWSNGIQFLLDNRPQGLSTDCETVGLDWHTRGFRILNVSVTPKKGLSYVVPLDVAYARDETLWGVNTPEWMKELTQEDVEGFKAQLRELFADPEVAVSGHNLKYDLHCLRSADIHVANWFVDTMQLAFVIDENMQSKSLDDCCRRWLPTHAGYADEFNKRTDKSRMDLVPHDEMLEYAGGDTDVTYRLTAAMIPLANEDRRNYDCFVKVQMPSLRTFVAMEQLGVKIDTPSLLELQAALEIRQKEMYAELLQEVPAKVLRQYEPVWNFGSADFLIACLFGPDAIRDPETGKRLVPIRWTASTKKLAPEDRVPSTSSKDHLPYFEHVPFVQKLMKYSKLQKVLSTYVGAPAGVKDAPLKVGKSGVYAKAVADRLAAAGIVLPKSKAVRRRRPVLDIPAGERREVTHGEKRLLVDAAGNVWTRKVEEPSGFWQYLDEDGGNIIHTSFLLHATNTGRTASRGPNMQNTPKRGDMAKQFRKIFRPPIEGWKFLELDYSQIELRIAAWMAGDRNMIQIYKDGGDIHSATAAAVTGINPAQFRAGRKDGETLLIEVANQWRGSGPYLQALSPGERKKATVKDYCDMKRYQAKAVNFGYLYGMGWRGFKVYAKTDYGIDYTDEEAQQTRINFFKSYNGLEGWHRAMRDEVRNNGCVRGLHGALRRLPNVTSFDDGIIGGAERQAINAPVQRFASDLGLIAINRVYRDAPPEMLRPVLFIHDALVPIVHPDYVQEAASAVKYYMENPPLDSWFGIRPPFPLTADVSVGDNLGEMAELEGIVGVQPSWYRAGEDCPHEDMVARAAWARKKKRGIILTD